MIRWLSRNALYGVLAASAVTSAILAQHVTIPIPESPKAADKTKSTSPRASAALLPLPSLEEAPSAPGENFGIKNAEPTPITQPTGEPPLIATPAKNGPPPLPKTKPIPAPDAKIITPIQAKEPTLPLLPQVLDAKPDDVGAPSAKPIPAPKNALPILPMLPETQSIIGGEPMAKPTLPPGYAMVDEELVTYLPSAWLTHPIVHYAPRAGNFAIPPKGPGHYSLRDCLQGEIREKAPKSAYVPFAFMQPGFFDADFRYVDAPGYEPDFLERLHRIHHGDNWLFGTGGQFWYRHMHESGSRLTGNNNIYDLIRARVYGDLWYKDVFRIYAEFITAQTFNEDLAPLRIDANRADLLNLFVDIKLGEWDSNPIYARIGRQEMNIGSTRLISSLDWANTRRTFEGVRGFWLSEKLDLEVFWVRPVLVDNTRFDFADNNQNFAGAWLTYRPEKTQALDLYYLYLDNHNVNNSGGLAFAPFYLHNLGARCSGDKNGFLWDFEGNLQLGDRGGNQLVAGMATAGVGYNWASGPMNPTIWAYYDWASGDPSPNSGSYNTFNPLFPFGHYYLGFADIVGRQNMRDINFHLTLYPTKWITFNAQYHLFRLDRASDALYNVALTPTRRSPNGSAGGDVGQELDLLINFHIDRRSDILLGWSKLYAGDFIGNTGNGRSPELFYAMYNFRW